MLRRNTHTESKIEPLLDHAGKPDWGVASIELESLLGFVRSVERVLLLHQLHGLTTSEMACGGGSSNRRAHTPDAGSAFGQVANVTGLKSSTPYTLPRPLSCTNTITRPVSGGTATVCSRWRPAPPSRCSCASCADRPPYHSATCFDQRPPARSRYRTASASQTSAALAAGCCAWTPQRAVRAEVNADLLRVRARAISSIARRVSLPPNSVTPSITICGVYRPSVPTRGAGFLSQGVRNAHRTVAPSEPVPIVHVFAEHDHLPIDRANGRPEDNWSGPLRW